MFEYTHQNYFEDGELIKVVKNTENLPSQPHTHNFIEIVYVYSGKGIQKIDGVEYPVKRGSLIFVNYGQIHSFDADNMTYYNILLKPDAISEKLINKDNAFEMLSLTAFEEFQNADTSSPFMYFDVGSKYNPEDIILKMYDEYNENLPGSQTALSGYATILLTYIFRNMLRGTSALKKEIDEISIYISEHISEKLSLQTLARKCFYSPKYFSRIFKECYGITVTEYIQKRRIDESLKLLDSTELSIDQVGRMVGYDDKVRFYKYFKKHMNKTPLEYKKSRKS